MLRRACLLLLALVTLSLAQDMENCDMFEANTAERTKCLAQNSFVPLDDEDYIFNYEVEGYDGWYNNLAHPEWGGSGTQAV